MSASNFHGIVNGSIEPNGTVRPRAKRTAPATAPSGHGSVKRLERVAKPKLERAAKPEPDRAGFVKVELQAQDAPMWPIHPDMWLQPELRLGVPAASGLRIERKHSVPSPEFLREPMTPVSHPASLQTTVHPVLPSVDQQLPASGLAPLGWDPRVASHGTGKEDQE